MMIKIIENGGITAPQGFKASGVAAGIRKRIKKCAIVYSEVLAEAAAYTINKFNSSFTGDHGKSI